MLSSFEPSQEEVFWSQTQKYQIQNSEITTVPQSL